MGGEAIAFYLMATVVLGSALYMTLSRSIVHCAFALLGTLVGSAGLFVMLRADFVAATQVLVYVGGVAVLFLFAVMLTHDIATTVGSNPHLSGALALPVGLGLAALLIVAALAADWPVLEITTGNPTVRRIGHAFLGRFLLPFELASVILLAVLVGAALVARREIITRTARARGEDGEG